MPKRSAPRRTDQERRPIATAPLDGTVVWLWGKGGPFRGYWSRTFRAWGEDRGRVPMVRPDVTEWAPDPTNENRPTPCWVERLYVN